MGVKGGAHSCMHERASQAELLTLKQELAVRRSHRCPPWQDTWILITLALKWSQSCTNTLDFHSEGDDPLRSHSSSEAPAPCFP